jgi:hypothetical protein
MASDFTVIQPVRQRFGDQTADFPELAVEQEAPFVGQSKDFPFSCPNVMSAQTAILQFETIGAGAHRPRNIVRINGVDIPGGITAGPTVEGFRGRLPIWKSHVLIVDPHVLREHNVLHIESVKIPFAHEQTLDNFIIDNIVIFFKVRAQSGVGPPDDAIPLSK